MTDMQHIISYHSAMAQARSLLTRHLISQNELAAIEELLAQKYSLKYDDLYRDKDLLSLESRGNMSSYKGGEA